MINKHAPWGLGRYAGSDPSLSFEPMRERALGCSPHVPDIRADPSAASAMNVTTGAVRTRSAQTTHFGAEDGREQGVLMYPGSRGFSSAPRVVELVMNRIMGR
jgi:hypothetical protein